MPTSGLKPWLWVWCTVKANMYMWTGGIAAGDTVIVTRLIDPLENTLLNIAGTADKESAS